jgi:hypothetical protein
MGGGNGPAKVSIALSVVSGQWSEEQPLAFSH